MAMLFPLFLRLEGKRVLVVGGGSVAERKALDLADAGAHVTVVAPEVTDALASDGRIAVERRKFEESDVDGAWLVVAATDDPITQARACEAADTAHLFSVAVDDPPHGSAISASVIRRGSFTVAISSSGEAPALARLLREVLEQALPEDDWLDAAKGLRERWKREGTPMTSRFAELVRAFKDRANG
jgi:siroheme synthase-like protein